MNLTVSIALAAVLLSAAFMAGWRAVAGMGFFVLVFVALLWVW